MACVRRRRGRWVADFRDRTGKRHWKTFDTKQPAEDWLGDLRRELREGTYQDPATLPTFEQVARDWLAVKRDHPASSFQYWQTQIERHLLPAFGHLRIDQLSTRSIEVIRNAKRDGIDDHEKLARGTINQLLQTLTAVLEYAASHRYVASNPGKQVRRLRAERRAGAISVDAVDPQEVLTAAQAAALIEAAEPGKIRTFIVTALHTGTRSGELLALAWRHLDLEGCTLKVERSLSWVWGAERGYGKSTPHFGPPKSDSSYRTIDLAPELVRDLKEWKLRTQYSRGDDLVFPNTLGKPLHRAALHKGLQKATAVANAARGTLPVLPALGQHGLRHTFASLMISIGKPVSQVSKILGHKNPEITLKTYTHWFAAESSAGAMADLATAIRRPGSGSKLVADGAIAAEGARK